MAEAKKIQYVNTLGITVSVGGKIIDGVTDIPALGATPEKIDVTTLADESRQYIQGIKDFGDLEFTVLYSSDSEANYAYLATLKEEQNTPVIITLKDGSNFSFEGQISVAMNEVAVNAALAFTMSVALSSEIEFSGTKAN